MNMHIFLVNKNSTIKIKKKRERENQTTLND
jgi:hypothetical protein